MLSVQISKRTQVIYDALTEIGAENDDLISCELVLQAAASRSHILHSIFDWDNKTAGHAFRLMQARALIRRVKLVVYRKHEDPRQVEFIVTRAFVSRPSQRGPNGGYERMVDVLQDPVKRAEMLETILRDLKNYRQRYQAFIELEKVWDAIDEVAEATKTDGDAASP